MAGDEPQDQDKDGDAGGGRRAIFTGDDLPPEDAIPPAGTAATPHWDEPDYDPDRDYSDTPPAPARLGLGDGEERLPWLESADDIDADEGFDSGRIIGSVLIGLAALAMIVGAVWYVSHRGASEADGSLIRAEKGPYKAAPDNPGGKKFAGTGDTSYAVAQGETRSGAIADGEVTPAPAVTATATPAATVSATPTPKPTPSPKPSATATASASPVVESGVGVQVGAYTSAADAEKGWAALAARSPALAGVRHRVVPGQADFGRVYRLQAVADDLAAANALCASLKASGQGCQVKR